MVLTGPRFNWIGAALAAMNSPEALHCTNPIHMIRVSLKMVAYTLSSSVQPTLKRVAPTDLVWWTGAKLVE